MLVCASVTKDGLHSVGICAIIAAVNRCAERKGGYYEITGFFKTHPGGGPSGFHLCTPGRPEYLRAGGRGAGGVSGNDLYIEQSGVRLRKGAKRNASLSDALSAKVPV
ncbi:hypothetical protein SDC9_77580 [bioreactor metagenome]|uniref:Uncharacterized protein n=1 Tax=bioreactor metagenome TaxID=1076179 RepID=A0A644YRV0_9ZZZZ